MATPLWRKALFFGLERGPASKGARFGIGSFFGDTPLGFACLHHPEGSEPTLRFYQRKATINEAQADAFRNQLAFWMSINKSWDKILEELGC